MTNREMLEARAEEIRAKLGKSKEPTKPVDEHLLKAGVTGLAKSLPGTAIRLLMEGFTEKPVELYEPKTDDEKFVAGIGEFGTDLLMPMGTVGKVGKFGYQGAKTLAKQGAKAGVREALEQGVKAGYKGSFLKDFAKFEGKKLAKPYLKETALKRGLLNTAGMATEGAAYGGLFNAKTKLNENIDKASKGPELGKLRLLMSATEPSKLLSIIPTLSEQQKSLLVNDLIPNNKKVPEHILDTAIEYAKKDIKEKNDKSIFYIKDDNTVPSKTDGLLRAGLEGAIGGAVAGPVVGTVLKTPGKLLNKVRDKVKGFELSNNTIDKISNITDNTLEKAGGMTENILSSVQTGVNNPRLVNKLKGLGFDKPLNKLITPTLKQDLTSKLLSDDLRKAGIDDNYIKSNTKLRKSLYSIVDTNTFINDVARTTGVDVMPSLNKSIRLRNEMTYEKEPIIKAQKFLDIAKKKYKITNDRLYDLFEGRVKPEEMLPHEIDLKARNEEITNLLYVTLRDNVFKKDVGYIKDYLPHFFKKNIYIDKTTTYRDKDFSKFNVPMLEKRILDEVPEFYNIIREKDPSKLYDKYWQIIERVRVKNAVGKDMDRAINSLEMRGYNSASSKLKNTYLDMLGFPRKGNSEYDKIFLQDLATKSREEIEKIALSLEDKPNILTKVKNELFDGMYKTIIGLSGPLQLAQKFQPLIMGGPEIGYNNVKKGMILRKSKAFKPILDSVRKQLLPSDIYMAELPQNKQLLGGVAGKVLQATKYPGKLGLNYFSKTELVNRETIFAGAYNRILKEGINQNTLATLSKTQRRIIEKAYNTGGAEVAAKEYGLIMSDRVNFLYNALNKPDILKNQLGDLIPFTTWRRGQWNTFYNDIISNKKAGSTLTKRAVIPAIIVGLANKFTGYNFSSADPTSGLFTVPTPMPMLTHTGSSKESWLKKFGKKTSPTYAITERLTRKEDTPAILRLLKFYKNFDDKKK